MLSMTFRFRDWLPATLSVCAVVVAAGYAVTERSKAADRITDANDLAVVLTQTAAEARSGMLTPEEVSELSRNREDLENRMVETRKPGLVVAELSESARRVGLTVREIQPVRLQARGRRDPEAGKTVYLRYCVSVTGSYRQIAQYMQLCTEQRLPARVVQCEIGKKEGTNAEAGLLASITFETFQPKKPQPAEQGAK